MFGVTGHHHRGSRPASLVDGRQQVGHGFAQTGTGFGHQHLPIFKCLPHRPGELYLLSAQLESIPAACQLPSGAEIVLRRHRRVIRSRHLALVDRLFDGALDLGSCQPFNLAAGGHGLHQTDIQGLIRNLNVVLHREQGLDNRQGKTGSFMHQPDEYVAGVQGIVKGPVCSFVCQTEELAQGGQ